MQTKHSVIAKKVIDLEIESLKKLKLFLNSSFNRAVNVIANCQSKVILCGVGKSGLIASKIASTMSSVGTPSFSISANDCSHGDMGSITKKDILILISNSGSSEELKNIIQYANRYKIKLIGIVSKRNSILYKNSDIKLLLPEVKEAGYGIVPTSSTTTQLALGDALAIATMQYKKFGKLDFKKYHPGGNLGNKLKTVEDLMLTKTRIPFVYEDETFKKAIKIINSKKLGVVIVRNRKNFTQGIFTDGDIKRLINKKNNFKNQIIKKYMTKNPACIDRNVLAAKALNLMTEKKITCLCVYKNKNKRKTIGILHIHNILDANIS